eukprot:g3477.t1
MGAGGCKDVDDVAALCMAHGLVDNGEADLLAVVTDTLNPMSAGLVSSINHHYGRDRVPIGVYANGPGGGGGSDMILGDNSTLSYLADLVSAFPGPVASAAGLPSGVEVYRRALASQKDGSVVIASIGLLTNLEALMASKADHLSPLSGTELLLKKVKTLYIMGGHYKPGGLVWDAAGLCTCNFCGVRPSGKTPFSPKNTTRDHPAAVRASRSVLNHLPPALSVVYLGVSQGLQLGRDPLVVARNDSASLASCPHARTKNVCRAALVASAQDTGHGLGNGATGYNWDPLMTLVAVRGIEGSATRSCNDCQGRNTVDAGGMDKWKYKASNQVWIQTTRGLSMMGSSSGADPKKSLAMINDLLCQVPQRQEGGDDSSSSSSSSSSSLRSSRSRSD